MLGCEFAYSWIIFKHDCVVLWFKPCDDSPAPQAKSSLLDRAPRPTCHVSLSISECISRPLPAQAEKLGLGPGTLDSGPSSGGYLGSLYRFVVSIQMLVTQLDLDPSSATYQLCDVEHVT